MQARDECDEDLVQIKKEKADVKHNFDQICAEVQQLNSEYEMANMETKELQSEINETMKLLNTTERQNFQL